LIAVLDRYKEAVGMITATISSKMRNENIQGDAFQEMVILFL